MSSLISSSTEHFSELPDRAAAPLWAATARYRLRPAPGGLALVQDLLNTRASEEYGPDLLRDAVECRSLGSARGARLVCRTGDVLSATGIDQP